jgi:hypothetical protein
MKRDVFGGGLAFKNSLHGIGISERMGCGGGFERGAGGRVYIQLKLNGIKIIDVAIPPPIVTAAGCTARRWKHHVAISSY